MSQTQQKWYSSGSELWVVPFQSDWYSQMDWWCQFFLSHNLDKNKFNSGQTYVVDVRRFLPNKKVWIYPPELKISDLFSATEKLATQLGLKSVRVFCLSNCEAPNQSTTDLKWSIVTPEQKVVT